MACGADGNVPDVLYRDSRGSGRHGRLFRDRRHGDLRAFHERACQGHTFRSAPYSGGRCGASSVAAVLRLCPLLRQHCLRKGSRDRRSLFVFREQRPLQVNGRLHGGRTDKGARNAARLRSSRNCGLCGGGRERDHGLCGCCACYGRPLRSVSVVSPLRVRDVPFHLLRL